MSTRDDVKVGANIQHFDTMTEQGHAAGASVIAGIAVFEGKNALQAKHAIIITPQGNGTADDRFVKKLQALVLTGLARRLHPDFARLDAIQPKPNQTA